MTASIAILAGVLGLGAHELVVILIILLVLFGGAKLPGLAKGIGQSIKEFKKAAKDDSSDDKSDDAKSATATNDVKKSEPAKTHGSN